MSLDKIKARLGSLSPARLNEMPRSAQMLLEDAMPKLIRVAEAARSFLSEDEIRELMPCFTQGLSLNDALAALEGET